MRFTVFILLVGCSGHTTATERSPEADAGGGGTASVFTDPSAQAGKSGVPVQDAGAPDSKDSGAGTSPGEFIIPAGPLELNGSSATLTLMQPPDSGCRDSGDVNLTLPAACTMKGDTFHAVMWENETDVSSETGFALTGNPTKAEVRMRIRSLPLSQTDCSVSNYVRLSETSFSADFECLKLQEPTLPNFCAAKGSVKFVKCWTP